MNYIKEAMTNTVKQYYSERVQGFVQKPNGDYQLVLSIEYADMQNKRITEGTAVYYERCSWSMAFDEIEDNQLNNRLWNVNVKKI
mgnify:CR=1 FL=1